MAFQIGQLASGFFSRAHPATQITSIVCMTVIAVVAMFLGQQNIAFIAIIAFSPTPTIALINVWQQVSNLMNRFDVMAVASKSQEVDVDE